MGLLDFLACTYLVGGVFFFEIPTSIRYIIVFENFLFDFSFPYFIELMFDVDIVVSMPVQSHLLTMIRRVLHQ